MSSFIQILAIVALSMFYATSSFAQSGGSLILLVDTSSSIDAAELDLQLNSYARAMKSVAGLTNVHIEVVVFQNSPVLISSGSNVDAHDAFVKHPRLESEDRGATCLATALDFVESIIKRVPKPVVLDISGDGEANCERRDEIPVILDRIASYGTQVNTLFINPGYAIGTGKESADLHAFYNSLRRNGGFTVVADGFADFELALFEKLVIELSFLE